MTKDEKEMMRGLYFELVGTPEKEGFISDMRGFKTDCMNKFKEVDTKMCTMETDMKPVIEVFKHWKFILGLIVGFFGLLSSIGAAIYYFVKIKGG